MLVPEDGDDVASYETETFTLPGGGASGPILKHKPGPAHECIYLGEHGCTIYDRRPKVCRVFDCRRFYLSLADLPRAQRKRWENGSEVIRAGKARLDTLPAFPLPRPGGNF